MDRQLTPYLVVSGAARALAFYRAAFGAALDFQMVDPGDGRIGHAEMTLGGARFMLADEYPDFGAVSPDTLGGTAVTLHLTSASADEDAARAVAAGALLLRAPADQSFGERVAVLQDPFGHRWMLSQRIEEVSPEDMQARWDAETSA